jgi:hypothetical protein
MIEEPVRDVRLWQILQVGGTYAGACHSSVCSSITGNNCAVDVIEHGYDALLTTSKTLVIQQKGLVKECGECSKYL